MMGKLWWQELRVTTGHMVPIARRRTMMNDWAQFTFFFTGPELQPGEEIPPYPPQRVYNNSNSLKVQCSFPESQDHTLNVIPYEAS